MQIRYLAVLQLCQVSSQKAEELSLSSGAGRPRTSGVWQAPAGSCVSSSSAPYLRVAGETYKRKLSLWKTIIPSNNQLKISCCLQIMGIHPMASTQRFMFLLNSKHSTEGFKFFLGCCGS